MNEFSVTRIAVPDFGTDLKAEDLGGQADWHWAIPGVYRALAAPKGLGMVPAAPRHGDSHAASLGYWNALQNLLVYRLGWNLPHRGLQWWYDSNRPVDDDVLRLTDEIWNSDGTLDVYLAWLLSLQGNFLVSDHYAPKLDPRDQLTSEWQRWLHAQQERPTGFPDFQLKGGWDPLHLTGHGQDPEPGKGSIMVKDGTERRAILTTGTANNWYATLRQLGTELPPIGDRSWKVDVYVKPIGFMGTYRQSRVTGFWFTGKHSVHLSGN